MQSKYNLGDFVNAPFYGEMDKSQVVGIVPKNGEFYYELNPMITVGKRLKIGNYTEEQNHFGFVFRPAKESEIQLYVEPTPEPKKEEKEIKAMEASQLVMF